MRTSSDEIVFPLGSAESGRADSPVLLALSLTSTEAEPHTLTSTTAAASSSSMSASGSTLTDATVGPAEADSSQQQQQQQQQHTGAAAADVAEQRADSEEGTPVHETADGEQAVSRARWQAPLSYGLLTAYELLRYLSTLVNPLQRHTSETHMQCALQLLTVALEAAGEALAAHAPLRRVLQCELCKHLARLLQTDRIAIFVATLRLVYLLVDALRTHLKYQLQYLLVKIAEIITGIQLLPIFLNTLSSDFTLAKYLSLNLMA